MITPTYEQQWQKITEAYMKDQIQPYDCNFCFCGTLAGSSDWAFTRTCKNMDYTYSEFAEMEWALLFEISKAVDDSFISLDEYKDHPEYEQGIFNGMTAALEVLRQIHEAKGDPTAKSITLTKRQLA